MHDPDTLQNVESDLEYVRRMEAYRLYRLEGKHREEVAKLLGVTVRTVNRWCNDVSAHLREEAKQQVETLRATLTSRWEHVYGLAMDGFQRSQRKKIETTIKEKPGEAVPPKEGEPVTPPEPIIEKTVKESEQAGSPAFLSVAADSLEAIGRLWSKEMDASDRRDGATVRVAGMTQQQMIQAQIKRLKDQMVKLSLNGSGGDGDRA